MNIEIKQVTSKKHWRDFFFVRSQIYRDDPAAVQPLRQMEKLVLDTQKHPFYLHAERDVFVAYRDGVPVGRIAGILDHLYNEHYDAQVGFFGFFESIDDSEVAKALISKAVEWVRQRGCEKMIGPVSPSMKGEFGVLVEGHENVPFIMMGHNPPYYESLILNSGLEVEKEFYCYRSFKRVDGRPLKNWEDIDKFVAKCEQKYPEVQRKRVTKHNFEQVIHDLNRLGNEVRAENYGFVPLTPEELDFMVSQLRRVISYDTVVVYYVGDRMVGFVVNLPDINWALKKTFGKADWVRMPQLLYLAKQAPRCRVIALGVDHEYRHKGVAVRLIHQLIKQEQQYDDWEFSWVVEDNMKSMRVIGRTMTLIKYKTFRLYSQSVIPT